MEAVSQHGLGCSVYFVPIALTTFLIAWASSFIPNHTNYFEYLEARHPDNVDLQCTTLNSSHFNQKCHE